MPAELLLGVVLFAAQSAAQPDIQATPPAPELLEFLGSFETEEGEWLDPFVLAEVDVEAAEQTDPAEDREIPEQTHDADQAATGGDEQP